jgi:type IV secretory pathway VirB4 component
MAKQNSTQSFIPVSDIRDGVVILKDGSMRSVLIASSINFALKSSEEQTAILLQFQNFLNSLDFSLQILIQSKKLNINPYLASLDQRLVEQTSDLIKIQTKEYIEFIRNFTESVNIMAKSFFVIIPYSPPILQDKKGALGNLFSFGKSNRGIEIDDTILKESKVQLEQRAMLVEQGLRSSGVRTARLGTEELIELFYKTYNPGEIGKPVSQEGINNKALTKQK